jgi:hypothetical protein
MRTSHLVALTLLSGCIGEIREPIGGGQPDAGTSVSPDAPDINVAEERKRIMREYSGCMTKENFELAQMAQKWSVVQAGSQSCLNCHRNGEWNFIATDEVDPFFQTITTSPDHWLRLYTVNLTTRSVEVSTAAFEAVAGGGRGHPTFTVPNPGIDAVRTFHDQTIVRQKAGLCGAPTLP